MLVQEALEAAGATGTNLQQVWGALTTCDFAPEMPADAAFTNFDMSQHLAHLSPRLQGYIIAAQRQAAGQGASPALHPSVHLFCTGSEAGRPGPCLIIARTGWS